MQTIGLANHRFRHTRHASPAPTGTTTVHRMTSKVALSRNANGEVSSAMSVHPPSSGRCFTGPP